MQNENTIGANQTPDQPSPQLQAPSGITTSSGQFTALFTLVALALSFLGLHYSPDQVESWVALANKLAITLGPLLAIVPVLMNYITSRGKIQSNTLMANAQILTQPPIIGSQVLATPHGFADGMTGIIGGNDWKDPQRYENLLNVAAQVGVPGAAQASALDQKIHPADLITGILSMFHKKTKTLPSQ